MKTLLILGGSNCQINAFKHARRNNIKTALFDYYDNPPAAALADAHYKVSTFDVDACLKTAAGLDIQGVMTLGTDQPVYTAAVIAKSLGLPSFIDEATALSVTNKAVMKEILSRHGIPSTESWVVDRDELAALTVNEPVVIKPLDSQGQRGVFLAESAKQAAEWFEDCRAFSQESRIICERFYPSDEITVSAWVSDGHCTVLTITDRVRRSAGRGIGICRYHRYPSVHAASSARVRELSGEVARAFGVLDGPLYIQMFIGKHGILVNEVACRIGGAFEDVFIPKITGFDILAAAMDFALNGQKPEKISAEGRGFCTELMIFSKEQRIKRLPELSEIMSVPFLYDAGFNLKPGDVVPEVEHSGSRVGHAVFVTDTAAQMKNSLDEFWRRMGDEFTS